MAKTIATQKENPIGLHQKYQIKKIVKNQKAGKLIAPNKGNFFGSSRMEPEFITVDVNPLAEYFVLRLEDAQKNAGHLKACRIAIHAYADAIIDAIPQLAIDLKIRYPLL